tara:strand:- start:120 stop:566 length:447 start_codon:yes stop_codon:yes gene_type:complete
MFDKKPKEENKEVVKPEEDDQPEYQEKIMFLVSTSAQGIILLWCLIVLSLGYVKLPAKMFGVDIPDQPRVDSTFAAGLLGNILAGMGISVGAGGGTKKKKNGEGGQGSDNSGVSGNGQQAQTIRIEQPLIVRTEPPTATANPPTEPTK